MGRGSLILVLGFSFILGYISLNLNKTASRAFTNMATYNEVTISHNIALSGANVGLSVLYQDPSRRGLITDQILVNGVFSNSRMVVTADSLNVSTIRLRSVSSYVTTRGKLIGDTVEVFLSTQRFNSFALNCWVTNFSGNDVFWTTGDTIRGRAHSNGNLHINGSPVFLDKLTISKAMDPAPGKGSNNAVLKGGYETGVAEMTWPTDLSEMIAVGSSVDGRKYTSEIWIDLDPGTGANNDGQIFVYSDASMTVAIDSIKLSSFSGVLLGTNKVHVQGTIDGQVSIVSLVDIKIEDNVLYSNRNLETSDDLLGLIAENNVVVSDNVPNQTDCMIDGCIFTRAGSFEVENVNSGPIRGKLTVTGSVIQNVRGLVGTYAGSNLKSGYHKDFWWDGRLADNSFRPPYFPGYWNKTLAILNWWESIRIPNFD